MAARDYYHVYTGKLGKSKVLDKNYVSYDAYKKQVSRGILNIVRQGKGEGNYALIEFESIPPKYKREIYKKHPKPAEEAKTEPLLELMHPDYEAIEYFTAFRYEDGSSIPTDKVDNITLWSNNAAILNAIAVLFDRHITARQRLSKKPTPTSFFKDIARQLESEAVCRKMPHNLPTSNRLRNKFEEYAKHKEPKDRYRTLIKKLKGQKNAEKITVDILHLCENIASLPTNPYNTKTLEYYYKFMDGEIQIADKITGEIFNPADYLDKNGKIVRFTLQALALRLNQPGIQAQIDKRRYNPKDFNDIHRGHRLRHNAEYSLSKISMDDVDLPLKDPNTKKRPVAYHAYDTLSNCRIGAAYSRDKNADLFLNCLRDVLVFCENNNFGIPYEVEVEHHIVKAFEPILEQIFPVVHFCAAGNSQEKRAEHNHRAMKYMLKKNKRITGRWHLKSKYNRRGVNKVDNEYKQKMQDYELSIIQDIQDGIEWNNSLHSNQNKFPGMTRLEVLKANLNPNLPKYDKAYLYQFIGDETQTTIRRNMYVQVQYAEYMLPSPHVLDRLASNNRNVKAYHLPDENGEIKEVHLYQNDKFICTCEKIKRYNEAIAERTQEDWDAKLKQDKYIAQLDAYLKGDVITKIDISHKTDTGLKIAKTDVEVMPDKQKPSVPIELIQDTTDWSKKAVEDFF